MSMRACRRKSLVPEICVGELRTVGVGEDGVPAHQAGQQQSRHPPAPPEQILQLRFSFQHKIFFYKTSYASFLIRDLSSIFKKRIQLVIKSRHTQAPAEQIFTLRFSFQN